VTLRTHGGQKRGGIIDVKREKPRGRRVNKSQRATEKRERQQQQKENTFNGVWTAPKSQLEEESGRKEDHRVNSNAEGARTTSATNADQSKRSNILVPTPALIVTVRGGRQRKRSPGREAEGGGRVGATFRAREKT